MGGPNAVAFVGNQPMDTVDMLGLWATRPCCLCEKDIIKTEPALNALMVSLRQKGCLGTIECVAGNSRSPEADIDRSTRNIRIFCAGTLADADYEVGCKTPMECLKHELQHAAEWCIDGPSEGCGEMLCSEMRAHFCAGQCSTPAGCRRLVRNKNYFGRGACTGEAEADKERWLNECTLDNVVCFPMPPEDK